MIMLALSLLASVAVAQDADDDGCVDTYANANGACVAPSAILGSGVLVQGNAEVRPYADIGNDTTVGTNVYIGDRTSIAGRVSASGNRPIGIDTRIGRRVTIGEDHTIGADNTIARAVQIGNRVDTAGGVTLGFGSELGDDVTVETNAMIGSLVTVGDRTTIGSNAVIARGASIADSSGSATVNGTVGPDVIIGSGANFDANSRIRKDATLGNNVTILSGGRVGRGATIGDDVTIGENVRIGAGATVTATTIVPTGTIVPRGETYDDPSGGSFSGGTLLNQSEMDQINAWIGTPNQDWTLCYKRSVHGGSSSTFHSRCDAYTGTVTVVSAAGAKFGGYTPMSWAGSGQYKTEPSQSSFLFSLTNTHKHPLISTAHHIYTSSDRLAFGGGHDLYLQSNMTNGHCNIGHTYACRIGSYGSTTCRNDFCGNYNYSASEVEVYRQD